jgi:cytochrome c
MIRTLMAVSALLALAACGRGAQDDTKTGATPSTSAQAVAAASVAAAAEPPASFAQCRICHTTEAGKHLIGPSLAGVYGRPAASAPGYPYSAALKQAGFTWDDATLGRFLEAPMKVLPGTRMTYAGLKDPAARAEVVAYLKTL